MNTYNKLLQLKWFVLHTDKERADFFTLSILLLITFFCGPLSWPEKSHVVQRHTTQRTTHSLLERHRDRGQTSEVPRKQARRVKVGLWEQYFLFQFCCYHECLCMTCHWARWTEQKQKITFIQQIIGFRSLLITEGPGNRFGYYVFISIYNSPNLSSGASTLLVTERRREIESQRQTAVAVTKPSHPSTHIKSPDKKRHGYKFVTTLPSNAFVAPDSNSITITSLVCCYIKSPFSQPCILTLGIIV